MPELPEVETVGRYLDDNLVGQTLESIVAHRPALRRCIDIKSLQTAQGLTLIQVTRRAKFLILDFAKGKKTYTMVMHLGMSGRIRVEKRDQPSKIPHQKHDHVVMFFDRSTAFFHDPRRFGMIEPLHCAAKRLQTLGPEPLDENFNGQDLYLALKGKKIPIKNALMNQNILAGLGNIYSCEALFWAGLSPFSAAKQLKMDDCNRLDQAIKDVLRRAIEAGGSSLRDHRSPDGNKGWFQNDFAVYGRPGEQCRQCLRSGHNTAILSKRLSQRSTFYCPRCQIHPH